MLTACGLAQRWPLSLTLPTESRGSGLSWLHAGGLSPGFSPQMSTCPLPRPPLGSADWGVVLGDWWLSARPGLGRRCIFVWAAPELPSPLREPLNKESSQHPHPPPSRAQLWLSGGSWHRIVHCVEPRQPLGKVLRPRSLLGWAGRGCVPGTQAACTEASAPPWCLQGLGHGDFPKGSLPSKSLPLIKAPIIPGYQLSEVRGQPSGTQANPTSPSRTRAAMTQGARAEQTLRRGPGSMFP